MNGDRIAVPLDFEDENSTIALQFIAEEFSLPEDNVILRYKVKHQGGSEQTHSKITLARPSRDSTDFEVHGEVIDDKSQIIPGAPPLYRSLDPDHLSISRTNEPELVDPFPLDCW